MGAKRIHVRYSDEAQNALSLIKRLMPGAHGELRAMVHQLTKDPEQWIPFLASRKWLWREGKTFVLQPGDPAVFRMRFVFPGDGIADLASVTFVDGVAVSLAQLIARSSPRPNLSN